MRGIWLACLAAFTAISAPGCVSWRRQAAPPAEVIADPDVNVVQVTTRRNDKLIVYQPRIVNDTLTGLPTEMAIQRVNVPVADITEVATQYRHIGKTVLAGLAIVGGVAVYGLLQSLNSF